MWGVCQLATTAGIGRPATEDVELSRAPLPRFDNPSLGLVAGEICGAPVSRARAEFERIVRAQAIRDSLDLVSLEIEQPKAGPAAGLMSVPVSAESHGSAPATANFLTGVVRQSPSLFFDQVSMLQTTPDTVRLQFHGRVICAQR